MDQWSVNPSDPRPWYPNKLILVIQLVQSLSKKLEELFTRAVCAFDQNKFKTSDLFDPSDWKNPAITLNSVGYNPGD